MKKFFFALLHSTRVLRLFAWLNRSYVPILCYHSVIDGNQLVSDPHKQHIPLHLFLKHLDYLQEHYHVIPLNEFQKARRENRQLPDYTAVLTFDDGFEDFSTVAAPHLIRRKLPATVFVITDRASARLPPNGEAFLTWDEIRNLSSAGLEVGSHTCTHPRLPDLPLQEAMRELAESLSAVRTHTEQADVALSYPFGHTSEQIMRMAESTGYSCAIASDAGPNSKRVPMHALGRTVIASDDDVPAFAARVCGLTWRVNRIKRMFRAQTKDSWDRSFPGRYPSATAESYD